MSQLPEYCSSPECCRASIVMSFLEGCFLSVLHSRLVRMQAELLGTVVEEVLGSPQQRSTVPPMEKDQVVFGCQT